MRLVFSLFLLLCFHSIFAQNKRARELGISIGLLPTGKLNAITDVNGKPAVFIKDKAEQFSISFIQKGESNAIYTSIIKGVEGGERVVIGNVYQMKMIYLNQ